MNVLFDKIYGARNISKYPPAKPGDYLIYLIVLHAQGKSHESSFLEHSPY